MPRKSSTPEVNQAARVSYAIEAMTPREAGGRGLRPTQAAAAICDAFNVGETTAWMTIRAAKRALSDAFVTDIPLIKAELVEFYRQEMADARAEGDRAGALKAAQLLARITGADAPSKVELSGVAGVLVVGPQEEG